MTVMLLFTVSERVNAFQTDEDVGGKYQTEVMKTNDQVITTLYFCQRTDYATSEVVPILEPTEVLLCPLSDKHYNIVAIITVPANKYNLSRKCRDVERNYFAPNFI